MRRHEREGYSKGDIQRRANDALVADQERRGLDVRGWSIPGTAARGFAELAEAAWNRFYRLWLLRAYLTPYEREYHLRRARICLDYARQCDRPKLPV